MQVLAVILIIVVAIWALDALLGALKSASATCCSVTWPILLIAAAIWCGFWVWKKREERERERIAALNAEQARIARQAMADADREFERLRREALISRADQILDQRATLLTQCLVIDSSIWMGERYEPLFEMLADLCHHHRYSLVLSGAQFDEMANIKNRTKFGDKKGSRARHALSRIERFQKLGFLTISRVGVTPDPSAYADPLLIRLLANEARAGVTCTLLTDDRELRIRARQHVADISRGKLNIVETDELLSDSAIVSEARQYRSDPSPAHEGAG